jgi:hypothetical protein
MGRKVEFEFYDQEILCSTVMADFENQVVTVKNEKGIPIEKTVFGLKKPTIPNLLDFFEYRSFSRQRPDVKELNHVLGIDKDYYSPFDIVLKTNGRNPDDKQSIRWL